MSAGVARAVRVADQIQRELAEILQNRTKDPRMGSVTVTGVKLTSDLRLARVYYVVRGDDEQKGRTKDALDSAKGFLRKEIGQAMRLKYTPDLEFFYDGSFDYAERIETIINRLKVDETD